MSLLYIQKRRFSVFPLTDEKKEEEEMASSVIGKLDSQVNKIFFEKGLSRSVEEAERLEKMTEEEKAAYLAAKKEREDDIVLF